MEKPTQDQSSPLPSRHGADLHLARKAAAPIRRFIKGDPEPDDEQWRAIGESLLEGDAPMDRLVDWMLEQGLASSKPLFDRALADGIASLGDAPRALRLFFDQVEATPDWVQPALLHQGAQACGISGLTGMRVLRDLGLLAGYQASAINRTLVLTGALDKGAQRRVAETSKWWVDCTRPGGMQRFAPGYQGTLQVRLIHALIRRRVQALPEWDSAQHGLPINQGDMHATYLAFSVIFLLGQRLLGVPLSRRDGHAVMHLWRYIAWLMGVKEDWLHESARAGTVALYHNLLAQAPPDDSSRQLGAALKDEPLQRHYPNCHWLRGHWNRALHLSIARTFIGQAGMRALGLPAGVLPWYPLLSAPPRLLWHGALRLLPGGRDYLIRRGLRQQQRYLATLFGPAQPALTTVPGMPD